MPTILPPQRHDLRQLGSLRAGSLPTTAPFADYLQSRERKSRRTLQLRKPGPIFFDAFRPVITQPRTRRWNWSENPTTPSRTRSKSAGPACRSRLWALRSWRPWPERRPKVTATSLYEIVPAEVQTSPGVREVKVRYHPHRGQMQALESLKRFVLVLSGTQ